MLQRSPFYILFLLFALLLLPMHSKAASFRYSAENTPLPDFLCAYASHLSKACNVSPSIKGTINGEFTFNSAQEFMGFIDRSKDISTYMNASSMFFDLKSALQNEVIPLGHTGVSGLKANLRQMGAFDPQYPLRSGQGGVMVMITAPKPYVDIIRSIANTLIQTAPPLPKVTRVFRLKHAFAEDVTINLGQQNQTLPGVASLLRQLVGTQDIKNANNSQPSYPGQVNRRMGQGLARSTGTQGYVPTQMDVQGRQPAAIASPAMQTGARILADPRLNAIIIWDEEHLMPFYRTVIEELDKSVLLVEIRAAIADINVNSMRSLGLSYQFNGPDVVGGFNTGTAVDPLNFASTVGQGAQVTTIFTNGIDTLMARIQALETKGEASVLSRPTILTSDNLDAVLQNTKTFYVQVQGYQTVDLFDVTYGTVLRVKPQIVQQENGKPLVKLVINIEDGVSTPPTSGSGLNLPQVGRTTISTQAVVGNQQALVIGGYYYETKQVIANGLPLLMHIPIIGHLFKTEEDIINKQERLFIISPRIIDPQNIPNLPPSLNTAFDKTLHPIVTPKPASGCASSVSMTPVSRQVTPVNGPTVYPVPAPVGGYPVVQQPVPMGYPMMQTMPMGYPVGYPMAQPVYR